MTIVYGVLLRLMRVRELDDLLQTFFARISRRR